MNSPSYSFSSKSSMKPPPELNGLDVAFVGGYVDDRGEKTVEALKNIVNLTTYALSYEPHTQQIYLNNNKITRADLTKCMSTVRRVLLDITTLGLGEILHILLAAKKGGHTSIEFLYAEPGKYTDNSNINTGDTQRRDFKLSTNCRFQSIQGFAHEYQTHTNASHVFFLGFEPGRIRNAFEQRGDLNPNYQIQVVFGVPAFQAGWESNAIKPHLEILENQEIRENAISYCQANSIRESYLTTWELYQQLGDEKGCFFVSPLGTKPHAVGAALFLLETKGCDPATSLYYDHPSRVNGRSKAIATWHHVTVNFPA